MIMARINNTKSDTKTRNVLDLGLRVSSVVVSIDSARAFIKKV
jgi:hypothetical protein